MKLDMSLFEWRWKNSSRNRDIDKICDVGTKFIARSRISKGKLGWNQGDICLLSKAQISLQNSVRVAEIKLISFGGGAGEWDGKNLVRKLKILSLKRSRNVLAREEASIWGLWKWVWRISVNSRYLWGKSTPRIRIDPPTENLKKQ